MSNARPIDLVAHRGDAQDCPENTLPAFRSALACGLRYLELDVHLSADGVPVVIHDHQLLRTTGRTGEVFDLTAAELTQIEAAERVRFGARFAGTCIPLLADVLTLLRDHPHTTLFVEIKRASVRRYGHERVVERVLEVLRGAVNPCVVISFDLTTVHHARSTGRVPIGWVLTDYDEHSRLKYEALQPEYLFCDYLKLPREGALWAGPWRWAIYEVETASLAQALAERGVQYIETMMVRDMSQALQPVTPRAPHG